MRKDMSKVVVERPRRGSEGWARPGRAHALEDDDGAPLRARVTDVARFRKTKDLNENLAPLKRYLESQLGRPWNKVYAEICENLKPSSTVQQHVRDHLDDFVARMTRMHAGKVVATGRWGGERTLDEDYRLYYVHPRTGLLRRNDKPRSWSARQKDRQKAHEDARAARMRVLDPMLHLHRLDDGAWYEVQLAPVKRCRPGDAARREREIEAPHVDVIVNAGLAKLHASDLYGAQGVYAVGMRKLTPAEKRRYGLK